MRKPIRQIRVDGQVAFVPLTRGLEAIIDASDVALVSGHNWYAGADHYTNYAVRIALDGGGKRSVFRMHRLIFGVPGDLFVDHINKNGLDNRRANLRLCTNSENGRNRGRTVKNTSGFKGVFWCKKKNKWRSNVGLHGKKFHVGYFETKEEAADAYAKAAARLHGEFARTK